MSTVSSQCQGAGFSATQCQGADFGFAQCQGAKFIFAQFQGADFRLAQCQGTKFTLAQFQGAYADYYPTEFKILIGKKTKLENMQFAGELDEEAIENIEEAKNHLGDKWYQIMQEIIEENKGKKADYTIPKGIITGKLADNAENRAIAEKNWEELAQIQKEKL